MIDVPFNSSPDFVGVIPFLSAADDTGICTEILFGIDIYHPATRRSSARIVTHTLTLTFAGVFILDPLDLRTDKLISGNTTFEF